LSPGHAGHKAAVSPHFGIERTHGIFVAVKGYTKDAKLRAEQENIQLLTLSGLNKKRLRHEIFKALQTELFLLLDVPELFISGEMPVEPLGIFDENGAYRGTIADHLWQGWLSGGIDATIGERPLELEFPEGWTLGIEGSRFPAEHVGVLIRVIGYALVIEGQARHQQLVDENAGRVDRFKTKASFNLPAGKHTFTPLVDQESHAAFFHEFAHIHVIRSVRLPRIRFLDFAYWPLSQRVADIVTPQMEAFTQGRASDPRPFHFEELEGMDLKRIWEPTVSGYVQRADEV
jgi:hypothetical protein